MRAKATKRVKVTGERKPGKAIPWERGELLKDAVPVVEERFLDEPVPVPTEAYQAHDIEILKAAREAAVTVVNRLQKDLSSLRLATLIANGAEAKLQAFGAWLNREPRPNLPEGLREIALCGMVLHAKRIKKQKDTAEKAACSVDLLEAYRADLEDLSNVVKGQLAFDWEAEVGGDEEDE